jgi:hypothetical protein
MLTIGATYWVTVNPSYPEIALTLEGFHPTIKNLLVFNQYPKCLTEHGSVSIPLDKVEWLIAEGFIRPYWQV